MDAIGQLRAVAARLSEVASGLGSDAAEEVHRLAEDCDALAERIEDALPNRSPEAHH